MPLPEQIFSIKDIDKHKVITFLGIKMRFKKENFSFRFRKYQYLKKFKGNGIAVSYYLSKYLYIADLVKQEMQNIPEKEQNVLTNNIWTMWLQDNVPELIQMCLATIKHIYPNTIIITEKNLFDYVDIPNYIWEKYKNGTIAPCHFSDYIRTVLLDKYGGTWLDSTCYMLTKIPEYIMQEKFFIMHDIRKNTISNFFIHSAKNNYIIKAMRIFLEEYWRNEDVTIDYFFFHSFFLLFTRQNPTAKKIWTDMPFGLNHNTWIIQQIGEKDFNKSMFDYLSKTSFMYKLNRKKKKAFDNPNSWYNFLLSEYRNNKLIETYSKQ